VTDTYNTTICGLFKIPFSTSDCNDIHVRPSGEWGIRKEAEGGLGLFEVLFHHLSGRKETATRPLAEGQTRYLEIYFLSILLNIGKFTLYKVHNSKIILQIA
jgi:hypothetical protein